MKKVLPGLVLMSFLSVLVIPMAASAAFVTCSESCTTKVTTDCICGSTPIYKNSGYCYNDTFYTSQSACEAAAGTIGGTTGSVPTPAIQSVEDLIQIVNRVVNWIFAFALAFAAIFIIIAGFNFMTAAGDQMKITKARSMLTNALIGVAIAIGVKGIMLIIGNLLGVSVPLGF
jgi:hypothetical protein